MFTISVEWFNDMFVSHINLNIKRHENFISFISLSKWKRRNQWIEKWTMHFSSTLLTNWNIVKRLTHTENMKKVSSFMSNWFTMRQFLLFLYSPICALACQNQVKPCTGSAPLSKILCSIKNRIFRLFFNSVHILWHLNSNLVRVGISHWLLWNLDVFFHRFNPRIQCIRIS